MYNDLELIDIAKLNLESFKKLIIDKLNNNDLSCDHEISDYFKCKFGLWYYDIKSDIIKKSFIFKNIELHEL